MIARRKTAPNTMRSASHVENTVARAAAPAARPNPSANRRKIPAPTPRPTPIPNAATLRLSSSVASSISSRAKALACSATSLTAGPTPRFSVSWVCMPPPVDELREEDSRRSRRHDHEYWVEASVLLPALAELRTRGHDDIRTGFLVGRRLTARSGDHQARLQLAKECRVFRKRRSE